MLPDAFVTYVPDCTSEQQSQLTLFSSAMLNTLARFSEANPEASLSAVDSALLIDKPWGDTTVQIRVTTEAGPLADALNEVRLPPRFTALWHRDSNDVEFIFSPQSLKWPLWNRKFTFHFEGKQLQCEYAPASERLRLIGPAMRPVEAPTETNHRNIGSLRTFARLEALKPGSAATAKLDLASFWIRNCPFTEDELPRAARHLNLFSYYFDRRSPRILVHEAQQEGSAGEKAPQHPFGTFPPTLSGRSVDPYLLGLWESAATSPEPARKFLYCYQIIEYSSFYFLKDEIYQAVRRSIATPDAMARLDEVARQILDVVVDDRTSDDTKFSLVVQRTVDPSLVWPDIEAFADEFCKDTTFEGGFSVPALIKKGSNLEDFKVNWSRSLPDSLRKLRNALVHAREQRQSRCIAPTTANQLLLIPWATIAMNISLQVMVFGDS